MEQLDTKLFDLNASSGVLTSKVVFDYESNASTYTIRVQARDEYNASVEGNFTVTLLNVNEPTSGSVVIAGTPVVGQTLTAVNSLSDPDGLGTITYQWYRDGVPILLGGSLKDGVEGIDGLDTAFSVALSPDGNHAYVTGRDDGAVSWYERNASTGALTYGGMLRDGYNGVDGLNGARFVTLSADGNHAYVAGFDDDSVSWFTRNGSTGALSYGGMLKDGLNGVDGLDGALCVTLSIDGNYAYVTGSNEDAISWHDRNASTGALTYGGVLKDGLYGVDGLNGAISVTLSTDGNHAYVTAFSDDSVSWFDINASTGALTFGGLLRDGVNGVDGLNGAEVVTISADGNHAYVTGKSDNALSWFERNASTGALSYGGMLKDGVNGINSLGYPFTVAISTDGNHAYVTAKNDDAVNWFARDKSTGALTFVGMLKDGVNGVDGIDYAYSLSLSADGNHANQWVMVMIQ